jgi:hypothetical protein
MERVVGIAPSPQIAGDQPDAHEQARVDNDQDVARWRWSLRAITTADLNRRRWLPRAGDPWRFEQVRNVLKRHPEQAAPSAAAWARRDTTGRSYPNVPRTCPTMPGAAVLQVARRAFCNRPTMTITKTVALPGDRDSARAGSPVPSEQISKCPMTSSTDSGDSRVRPTLREMNSGGRRRLGR